MTTPNPATAERARRLVEDALEAYFGHENECVCNGCVKTSHLRDDLARRIAEMVEEATGPCKFTYSSGQTCDFEPRVNHEDYDSGHEYQP